MIKDSLNGFGLVSILIHWVSAALVLAAFGLGIYIVDLTYYDPGYHTLPALHISLGLILFILMVVRVVWRMVNATPEYLPAKPAQIAAAKLVKVALYISIFLAIVSGYLITTAEGQAASLFDVIYFPALVELSPANVDLAGEIHKYLAWSIIGLVSVHTFGALFHHFAMRDATFTRMLKPARRQG